MRYPASDRLFRRAERITPGASQTRSKAPTCFPRPAYPYALVRGDGACVWDVDGHRYLDWIAGLGAVTLGHRHPRVDAAVRHQLSQGVALSLPTELETIVAERLCDVIPCAEMVRFVKTGSEATRAAVLIAQAVTGRMGVVTQDGHYHGWHQWEETPIETPAAYIVEPALCTATQLQHLRAQAHQAGALLIFDEIVSGFRVAVGGVQEATGIIPDLACFGKGMANGYPMACVVGKREYMQPATVVSSTFGGDCIGLAACSSTLDVYTSEPVIETLRARGQQLIDGFNALVPSYASLDGPPWRPRLYFHDDGERYNLSLFLQETARRGLLLNPSGFTPMSAQTTDTVNQTIEICRETFHAMFHGAQLEGAISQSARSCPLHIRKGVA